MSGTRKCVQCRIVSIPSDMKFCSPECAELNNIKEGSNDAIKDDKQKPDLSLLPRSAKEGIAKAFMNGAERYGRYNYLKGMKWTRILAAAERHLTAFNDGEDVAEDSQLNHLYHAGACIMMLIEYYEKGIGEDDRKS